MSETTCALLAIAFGYTLGAIPFGVFIARRRGINVRSEGSGNSGAANVARTVGKKAGLIVLLLDALKGALPLLAWHFVLDPQPRGWWLVGIGLAPIIGHCFSPWLRFRGGKGVATALGVFLALEPPAAGVALATFIVVYAAFRIASVGSIVATAAIGIYFWLRGYPVEMIVLAAAAFVLITIRHHANLRRLLQKRELHV